MLVAVEVTVIMAVAVVPPMVVEVVALAIATHP
jgi:hypothetical protein